MVVLHAQGSLDGSVCVCWEPRASPHTYGKIAHSSGKKWRIWSSNPEQPYKNWRSLPLWVHRDMILFILIANKSTSLLDKSSPLRGSSSIDTIVLVIPPMGPTYEIHTVENNHIPLNYHCEKEKKSKNSHQSFLHCQIDQIMIYLEHPTFLVFFVMYFSIEEVFLRLIHWKRNQQKVKSIKPWFRTKQTTRKGFLKD